MFVATALASPRDGWLGWELDSDLRDLSSSAFRSIYSHQQRSNGCTGPNHRLDLPASVAFGCERVAQDEGPVVNTEYSHETHKVPTWLNHSCGSFELRPQTSADFNDADSFRLAAMYGVGIPVMHSGGDRGIESYFDGVEEAIRHNPYIRERRRAMEHSRLIVDQHFARAQKRGSLSCGPKSDSSAKCVDIGAHSVSYGSEIAADIVVPFRRLTDHHFCTIMQLDQNRIHPFLVLEVDLTRKDATGKVWGSQRRISRRESSAPILDGVSRAYSEKIASAAASEASWPIS